MTKISIFSTRIYKKIFSSEDLEAIQRDITIYQSMFKKCYKELLDNINYRNGTMLTPKYLQDIYPTSDAFAVNAIQQSKAFIKVQVAKHQQTLKNKEKEMVEVEEKIKNEENTLALYQKTLTSLIALSKARKEGKVENVFLCPGLEWRKETPNVCDYEGEHMYVYLFEERKLKPKMKEIRNRIKQLKRERQSCFEFIQRLESRMKGNRFEKSNYMKVLGIVQNGDGHPFFQYDDENLMMTYMDTKQKKISFPLEFPYQRQVLFYLLKMKQPTIDYTLVDKGDYFMIQATFDLEKKENDVSFE